MGELGLEQQHDLGCEVGDTVEGALDRVGQRPPDRRVTAAHPGAVFPRFAEDVEPPAAVQPVPSPCLVQLVRRFVDRSEAALLAVDPSSAIPLEVREHSSHGREAGAGDHHLDVLVDSWCATTNRSIAQPAAIAHGTSKLASRANSSSGRQALQASTSAWDPRRSLRHATNQPRPIGMAQRHSRHTGAPTVYAFDGPAGGTGQGAVASFVHAEDIGRMPDVTPTLVVVSGPPGSGKTSLAHAIAQALPCPAICRDEIKEGMAHAQGPGFQGRHGDPLTQRTLPLFFEVVRVLIEAGVTVVAEAAFQDPRWRPELEPLSELAQLRIIRCHVDPAVSFERAARRAANSQHRVKPTATARSERDRGLGTSCQLVRTHLDARAIDRRRHNRRIPPDPRRDRRLHKPGLTAPGTCGAPVVQRVAFRSTGRRIRVRGTRSPRTASVPVRSAERCPCVRSPAAVATGADPSHRQSR